MKLKYIIVCVLICLCTVFTGCGGDIDYDLSVSGFQFRYEVVTKMKSNPNEYKNKTIKLRGTLKSNGSSYYYLTETDNVCCTWKMEVKLKDDSLKFPDNKEDIIVIGNYSDYTINGSNRYYLEITEFVENV